MAVLLGLHGLRVSEACATDIENLDVERGDRTPRIVGKGNRPGVVRSPGGPDRGPSRRSRTTTVYDHGRRNFDTYATYVVVAFVAGG